VITALEAEAWARLDRHLHEKYDPTALGGRADIHYNLNVEPNSPWVNIQADIFYAEVPRHQHLLDLAGDRRRVRGPAPRSH
jgi:hypothetical protein